MTELTKEPAMSGYEEVYERDAAAYAAAKENYRLRQPAERVMRSGLWAMWDVIE